MIVAWTGPEKPQVSGGTMRFAVLRMADGLPALDVREVRTGAAFGVDTAAFFQCVVMFPTARHRVYVPQGCRYNQELVAWARFEGHEVIGVPGGFMKRNDALVAGADVLCALPNTGDEVRRSGTWATIRRARKQGLEIRKQPLDAAHLDVVCS